MDPDDSSSAAASLQELQQSLAFRVFIEGVLSLSQAIPSSSS